MEEFAIKVVGMSFVLAQESPPRPTSGQERSLMVFRGDGVAEPLHIRPAEWLRA